MLKANELKIGDTHSEVLVEDLKRTQIVQYAGASGDYNPLHTDEIFTTKIAGYPTVFAHGMLIMAYLGRALTNIIPQSNLKNLNTKFCSITNIGDVLTCSGSVSEVHNHNSKLMIVFDIMVADETGNIKIIGTATIEK